MLRTDRLVFGDQLNNVAEPSGAEVERSNAASRVRLAPSMERNCPPTYMVDPEIVSARTWFDASACQESTLPLRSTAARLCREAVPIDE